MPLQTIPAEAVECPPSVTFETIEFSDGTSIELLPNDIVVFVGPNNAGKSAALRDLDDLVINGGSSNIPKIVIKSATLRRAGTLADVEKFLEANCKVTGSAPHRQFHWLGSAVFEAHLLQMWQGNLSTLGRFFCHLIRTETRISDGNLAPSQSFLNQPPNHPIHLLYLDECLEEKLSNHFQNAFGRELLVFRMGGAHIPLLIGQKPSFQPGEDRLSPRYLERLHEQNTPLDTQGDGMRSFTTVILRTLAPTMTSLVLLDEPEAFLHPPQARLLGELLAKERPANRQLFIATHSPDVLQGLLNAAPANLRIIRLQRDRGVNLVRELDKGLVKRISTDSIMRFSSVLSGVFHKRVIICESDSDCMLYSTILDIPSVHGVESPDVLFVQANGKHRLAMLAETLRALDVTVDVIADIDVLNDLTVLKRLVASLGGDWNLIEPHAKAVKASIETAVTWLDAKEVTKRIQEILRTPQEAGAFSTKLREEIFGILGKSSPWSVVKSAGETAIAQGDATKHYQELRNMCNSVGLWIVPVGEAEGFCKSEGGHGPSWVQNVLEKYNVAESAELAGVRDFVQRIWERGRVGS
ncbi:ATP-dependent nuclease [Edaphobacter bradus]|uniref:ATP-dependent nuclease n=1 Tax=Edaphobacter bradus TaxID=2259016 RepID=UPI0021DFCB10|nr:AAA family ATPase [Edaphobacter bradus]